VAASFCFDHVFRAPGPGVLFDLYFDSTHQANTDTATKIASRELLEHDDTPETRRRVCRVTPERQLPAFMRPFFPGRLHYVETVIWRKAEDRMELEIRPSLLGGRSLVTSSYRLRTEDPGMVRRTYEGSVSVEVALVGGRIERKIIADMERTLAISARCTQDYLDRRATPPVTGVAAGT
jgi:hypothetical protein